MTKDDIRDSYFGYNQDLRKLDKSELLDYIFHLQNKIIQMDKEIIREI